MLDYRYDCEMPEQLRAVALRHEQHITKLVVQLRSLGMEEEVIQRSVDELISSYRGELVDAIKALAGCRHA